MNVNMQQQTWGNPSASTTGPGGSVSSTRKPQKNLWKHRWTRLASLDMYRKVPNDLLEGSQQGNVISWIAIIVILILAIMETRSFLGESIAAKLSLDKGGVEYPVQSSSGIISKSKSDVIEMIQVYFNITMMDLKCEYASIDLVSVLGKEQNVTKDIKKWSVDQDGVQKQYMQRNLEQNDVPIKLHDTTEIIGSKTIEDLHKNGEDAVSLTPETFKTALESYDFVFLDFFAMWCSHCRMLAPTWEAFAETMEDAKTHHKRKEILDNEYDEAMKVQENAHDRSILVAKIDCVQHHEFCRKHSIMGYPTLRLFVNGKRYDGGDFHGHRTILSLIQFLAYAEERTIGSSDNDSHLGKHVDHVLNNVLSKHHSQDEIANNKKFERNLHNEKMSWNPGNHPGCQISGQLLLNKVPGHFYVQARSSNHDIDPVMANLSHQINHLAFRNAFISKDVYQNVIKSTGKENGNDRDDKEEDQASSIEAEKNFGRYNESEFNWNKDKNILKSVKAQMIAYNRQHRKNDKDKVSYLHIFNKLSKENYNPLAPMNGNVYITEQLHQAHHHYLKLISVNGGYFYQVIQNSQISLYDFNPNDTDGAQVEKNSNRIPEAKFIIDISPIAVSYKIDKRPWYDYITSMLAIIGGTFTLLGIFDSITQYIKRLRKKIQTKRQHQSANIDHINNSTNFTKRTSINSNASNLEHRHAATSATQQSIAYE